MKNEKKNVDLCKSRNALVFLVIAEIFVILSILSILTGSVFAGVGTNVTVITRLDVGNVYPEVINVSVDNGVNGIDLVANSTKNVTVVAVVRDFNGETDFNVSTAELFDNVLSSYGSGNDNNTHYTNTSCFINLTYGTAYEALVTCKFEVWYYANNNTWNSTLFINDTYGLSAIGSDTIAVNKLLAIGLPNQIDYGTVNATNVSDEKTANVINYGNMRLNLSLEGYAVNRSDGWAMNCSLGTLKNISIGYEKYNLTVSNTSMLTLAEFQGIYVNLTNVSTIKNFGLSYRQGEVVNEAVNTTYWRIYVPIGVAGTCTGNIIFGATQATGS